MSFDSISSIVVGITGEEQLDSHLMAIARQLATGSDTKITAVSVLRPSEEVADSLGASVEKVSTTPYVTHSVEKRQIHEHKRKLLSRLDKSPEIDTSQVEVRFGIVNRQLIAAAEQHKADLIIVGRHDRSFMAK